MSTPILEQIAGALPEPPNCGFRGWFHDGPIQAYIRLNRRIIFDRVYEAVELANIDIEEHARGKRLFSELIDGLIQLAAKRGEILLVENVLNDIVRGALSRRGFVNYDGLGCNYMKVLTTTARGESTMTVASFNPDTYTLAELNDIVGIVKTEIEKRKRKEVSDARQEIENIAAKLGMSVKDLLGAPVGKKFAKSKGKLPAVYRDPDDANLTWSGMGRKPGWVVARMDSGYTLPQLAIEQRAAA